MSGRTAEALFVVVVLILFVLIVAISVNDCNKKKECRDNGGTVVEYDCHTTTQCTTVKTGSNSSRTSCHPVRSCSWRCDGLPAERP